jgi:HEAT repeat protein
MATDTAGIERALGAIGTTFRLSRLYPPTHPALVEAMRQITSALPALAALGSVEWKIGATGLHWNGQQVVPRNTQVAELAELLYTRGIRSIQVNPGLGAEHILALFGVATGTVPPDDATLGQITLGMGRRSQRLSALTPPGSAPAISIATPRSSVPAIRAELPASAPPPEAPAPPPPHVSGPRASVEFRPDVVPVDVEVTRAIASLKTADTLEVRRAAVETLRGLVPSLLGLHDVGLVAAAIGALDRLLASVQDAALAEAIGAAAGTLADKAMVERMVSRLGEPRVPQPEREALVTALGALASLSVGLVLHAYLAAPTDVREPYRAVIRRAGDRALESLQGRLADKDATVVGAAAELVGLTGAPQALALLLPLLRHESEFVRESALVGLAEIGGREICRPVMPALKDESVEVRRAAARAIAAGGDVAATTVLVRRLEQEEDAGVLAELLRAVGRLGAREAIEVLAKYAEPGGMLSRRSATVRAAAVEGLARVGSSEARGFLELYTHDKDPAVRKAAEAALR